MRLHGNARTCPRSRQLIVDRVLCDGWSLAEAGAAAGVSERTAAKWLSRYRAEGAGGRFDRSSAPLTSPSRTSDERVSAIAALRRLRMTAAEIAELLSMPLSTVSAVLARVGLGKRSRLEPLEPPNRYERRQPGELLHIDVKKLGKIGLPGHRVHGDRRRRARGIGWEFVHVCVDDTTRLAYVEVLPDEHAPTCASFLRRAVSHFAALAIQVKRVMTDNGNGYRSHAHALTCHELGLKHLRTRPYRPRTNGKAERFIRTLLDGCAYGAVYPRSEHRTAALTGWLDFYNHRRPHGSLSHQPPMSRLLQLMINVPGSYN
jgi:transposase InsO family protein